MGHFLCLWRTRLWHDAGERLPSLHERFSFTERDATARGDRRPKQPGGNHCPCGDVREGLRRRQQGASGVAEGARFGFLVAIFAACTHIADNYVVLQIGGKLAAEMALATLGEWTLVGIVIGLVYLPREMKGGIV
jgi:hypothetical protein